MEKASYEGVVKIRSSLEDLMARMLALKRDGHNIKGSMPMREIFTDSSVLFIDLRRVSSSTLVSLSHPDCCDVFDVVQCTELLSQPSFDILAVRQTEAAIPSSHRVYCPFPDCSAFMEKSESSSGDSAFVECCACHRGFCLSCSAAWHAHQTCAEHRADAQNAQQSGDQKLRELADQEKWQKCSECHRIIELNEGCYHMTCLCGNEFCYTCGAKWKNKVASCRCKLWDESSIVRPRPGRRFFGQF